MDDFDLSQLAIIWTLVSLIMTTAVLVLLFNFQHKYSETFFNLIVLGCVCSCFCFLKFLRVYWTASDKNLLDIKKLQDDYLFSVVIFVITVGILFGSVTVDRYLYRICFAVYIVLALVLIISREKTLQRIYSYICPDDFNSTQAGVFTETGNKEEHVLSTESNLQPNQIGLAMTCSNRFGPVTTTLVLEYALIYFPISIMFLYKTQDKEWMDMSYEKCPGCEHNISLCHQCTVFYNIVIWIVRPFYLIVVHNCNSFVKRYDVIPFVTTLSIYVLLQIYIVIEYTCGDKRSKDVCINSADEMDLVLWDTCADKRSKDVYVDSVDETDSSLKDTRTDKV